MNEVEINEFNYLVDNEFISFEIKYKEKYFIIAIEYHPEKWTKDWLNSDKNYFIRKQQHV